MRQRKMVISAAIGIILFIGDMIFHTSHIKPFWSESMIIGLVGYITAFIAISARSFLT